MDKKIKAIYAAAQKCGLSAKHRISDEIGTIIIAFKAIDLDVDLYFWVGVDDNANEVQFVENVAHEIFLRSENIDPHTETRKYLEKIGAGQNQYTNIYSRVNDLAWKVRNLWFSL